MIVESLLEVIDEIGPELPVVNVEEAKKLINHAELGEAFLLVCTQIYEYEVSISREVFDKIDAIGQLMSLPDIEWRMLEELVCDKE